MVTPEMAATIAHKVAEEYPVQAGDLTAWDVVRVLLGRVVFAGFIHDAIDRHLEEMYSGV